MKKMFFTVLSLMIIIFASVTLTKLVCDRIHEADTINLQTAKSLLEDKVQILEASGDAQKRTIVALQKKNKELSLLEKELVKKKDEIEMLNDIIVRTRIGLEADKLSKERIPYGATNTIRYMDYRKITDVTSAQYELQQLCKTKNGIRYYEDYICVALGSAYGRNIGDTWRVTLECGTEFDVILADFKDDGTSDFFGHVDENYDGQPCTNLLEFVVDERELPPAVKKAGTFTVLGYYGGLYGKGGNVAKMEYLGRKWGF